MNLHDTFAETLIAELDAGVIPAIVREPGIGVIAFVRALAVRTGTQMFMLSTGTLTEEADLSGERLVPTADGTGTQSAPHPHHAIQTAIDYALLHSDERPLLFIDEVDRATQSVQDATLSLITSRAIGVLALPANLRIIVGASINKHHSELGFAAGLPSKFSIHHINSATGAATPVQTPVPVVYVGSMLDVVNNWAGITPLPDELIVYMSNPETD